MESLQIVNTPDPRARPYPGVKTYRGSEQQGKIMQLQIYQGLFTVTTVRLLKDGSRVKKIYEYFLPFKLRFS